jgi:hypothetical protein
VENAANLSINYELTLGKRLQQEIVSGKERPIV